MSILKVARMGHPVLRERARPVEPSELKHVLMQKLIDDMIETMHEYHGVGLAGPQVHEDLRIFVALLAEDPDSKTEATALINPQIVPNTQTTAEGWEGCLSIPDIRGMVPRFTDVTVRALDRRGKTIEIPLKDFAARVAQHETDHLDGVLFFDRMTSMQSLTYLDEYSRYHAKDDDETEDVGEDGDQDQDQDGDGV
jgi:peptide deformylase